jgi:hypothetical protein
MRSAKPIQNYKNHRKYIPMFHLVTSFAIFAVTIGSFVNLSMSWRNHDNLYSASLICVITLILGSFYWYIRSFPMRVQDRAIRAEENLRHFALTGKLLDRRLRMGQIIALRFASDEEFVELAGRAAEENLRANEIKKQIRNWRADHYRA